MAYNPYQAPLGMYPPQQQGQGQQQQLPSPGYPPTHGVHGYPVINQPQQPGFPMPQQGFVGQQQQQAFPMPYQDNNTRGYPPQGNMTQGYPLQQQVPGYPQQQNYTAQSMPAGNMQPMVLPYGSPAAPGAPYPGPYPAQQQLGPYPAQQQPGPYPVQQQPGPYPAQPQHGQPGYPGYAQPLPPQQQQQQQQQHQQPAQQFSGSHSQYNINQINNDVRLLREAMKGVGTDEKAIINIVGPRTPEELQMLCNAYKGSYGITLEEMFNKETSGDFGKLLKAIVTPPVAYDAQCLHQSVSGLGTDEDLLIEVLVARPNVEIRMLKDAYRQIYHRDLEQAVADDLSGHTKRLFVALLQGSRDESGQVLNVDQDAEALYKAGEKRMGTDESTFISILCTRSENHLRSVFRVYEQKYKTNFLKVIKKEFSGSLEKTLLSLVNCINNRPLWAAKLFESSMAGLGTNETKLIRLTTRFRAPNVLQPIKDAYLREYGKHLSKRISGEVSGDFKRLLLALVGESS